MSKMKYHFFAICANCGKQIVLHEAPSPSARGVPQIEGFHSQMPSIAKQRTHTWVARWVVVRLWRKRPGTGQEDNPLRPFLHRKRRI